MIYLHYDLVARGWTCALFGRNERHVRPFVRAWMTWRNLLLRAHESESADGR